MNTASAHERLSNARHYAAMHTGFDLHNALEWRKRYQKMIDRGLVRTLVKPFLVLLGVALFDFIIVSPGADEATLAPTIGLYCVAALIAVVATIYAGLTIADFRAAPSQVLRATERVEEVEATIAKLEAEAEELEIEVARIDALAVARTEDAAAKDRLFAWFTTQYPNTEFELAMDFLAADLEAAGRRA
jgi:hypothetical protein